jgi:hypothetical protein
MTRASQILSEAQELLDTARVGLQQAKLGPDHVKAGLRNVGVYGKMVTFCTNNLRSKVARFDDWDSEAKKRHFDNHVARAMSDARNQFEKQARTPIFSSVHINRFSTDMLETLPKPRNAVGFFIGDRFGGSGWMVQMENGDEIPFYVDLPPGIAEARTVIAPSGKPIDLLAGSETYLQSLQDFLDELRAFIKNASDERPT